MYYLTIAIIISINSISITVPSQVQLSLFKKKTFKIINFKCYKYIDNWYSPNLIDISLNS